jgi:endopeptidase La
MQSKKDYHYSANQDFNIIGHIVRTRNSKVISMPISTRKAFFYIDELPEWSVGDWVLYDQNFIDAEGFSGGAIYKVSSIATSSGTLRRYSLRRLHIVKLHRKDLAFLLDCTSRGIGKGLLKEHQDKFKFMSTPYDRYVATTGLLTVQQEGYEAKIAKYIQDKIYCFDLGYINTLFYRLLYFTYGGCVTVLQDFQSEYFTTVDGIRLDKEEKTRIVTYSKKFAKVLAAASKKNTSEALIVNAAFEFTYALLHEIQIPLGKHPKLNNRAILKAVIHFMQEIENGAIFSALSELCSFVDSVVLTLHGGTEVLRDQFRLREGKEDTSQTEKNTQQEDTENMSDKNFEDDSTKEVSDIEEFVHRLHSLDMTYEAYNKVKAEIIRMGRMPPHTQEYESIRNWVEKTLSLPWGAVSKPTTKLPSELRHTLDERHYGLTKVKDVITEHLGLLMRRARLQIRTDEADPIICLVGPPGVGKSTIAKSIADALGRKFERIALGGLRDIHDLKGHRKTYLGAVHGAIIDRLISAKVDNPVILLDEIDKLSHCYNNIFAAILDILDAEQNKKYRDAFIDIDYDISKVMFIATANSEDFNPALANRMHIIQVEGYTHKEKVEIANKFILPKLCKNSGVSLESLEISPQVIKNIIVRYTSESGVRELNRCLHSIVTKVALDMEEAKGTQGKYHITEESLYDYIGCSPYSHLLKQVTSNVPIVGVVNGLAVHSGGGLLMRVEASALPGKGKIHVTGNLGKVMSEAASVSHICARNYIIEHWGDKYPTNNQDVYLHYPTASPKDGPSAGVATCVALVSTLTNKPIRRDFAVTGEVNLHGDIMRIGGIRYKVQAAIMSGLKTVFLPESNKEDGSELPKDMLEEIQVVYANNIADVILHATTTGNL